MKENLVGIQVGPISLVDEGVEKTLDRLKTTAKVNAVMLGTTGYDVAVNVPSSGYTYVDHGHNPRGRTTTPMTGSWVPIHPEYYKSTSIRDFRVREEELRDIDVLEMVLGPARDREMKVFSWLRENPSRFQIQQIPGFVQVLEIDLYGRRLPKPCVNNPEYRAWWLAIIEDHQKTYAIDGFLFNVERRGPLGSMLNAMWNPDPPGCFCAHCRALAAERSINVDRARTGMERLWEMLRSPTQGNTSWPDGFLVAVLRVLMRYPEVLAWNQLTADGMDSLRAEMYGVVKAIDPDRKIGWHIYHQAMFSPFFRAETDYASIARFSDFVKPVIYPVVAGVRFAEYIRNAQKGALRDLDLNQTLALFYSIMGWQEASLDELPQTGFSPKAVEGETRRVVAAVGDVPVYNGIDLGIPDGHKGRNASREDVKQATMASYRGGAKGLVISRMYHEMELDALAGVGDALEEIGPN